MYIETPCIVGPHHYLPYQRAAQSAAKGCLQMNGAASRPRYEPELKPNSKNSNEALLSATTLQCWAG